MFNTKLKDNRLTFLAWNGLSIAITFVGFVIMGLISEGSPLASVASIFVLFGFAVGVFAAIRRLNALEWSKWNALWFCIPLASMILGLILLFTPSKPVTS